MKDSTKKLKEFRLEKGLTKQEMADKLGYTLSLYEKVEDGRAGVSAKFMSKFKIVFPNVSIDSIFFN
ncbi:MAG: helix-turn-helix transcriptional regulator [Clostridia bacterium]|nr:helix-turn-helix transcriptional regulator [Clostridia bacterium]